MVTSFDPRTGKAVEEVQETGADDVARRCATAVGATAQLEALGRGGRAAMLRAMADALEADRELLVETADRETALGPTRLGGELTRTTFQLRFFADVIEDGAYLEATIDHAGDTAMGPRPDLRKMLRPLGPVGVFGASNFPFAFSVPGGDTASALAAGCAVVIKGHEAHPRTSQLCAAALQKGAAAVGVTEDVVSLVLGRDAGTAVVLDPNICAVGFTGSVGGGRALHDLASIRPDADPVLRRARCTESAGHLPVSGPEPVGRDRHRARELVHPRRRTVLHQARPRVRPSRQPRRHVASQRLSKRSMPRARA